MPTPTALTSDGVPAAAATADYNIWDMLVWLGQAKRKLIWWPLILAVLMLLLGLIWPKTYTARTTLLPPSNTSSSASAALAALGPMLGTSGLGGRSSDELYVRLLNSDSVLRNLDQRLHLRERMQVRSFETLRLVIPSYVRILNDKRSGLVLVEVDDEDPIFSATWANSYYQALKELLSKLAVTDAQQRRAFFEYQVTQTKKQLVQAEQDLQRLQVSTGVVALDQQAGALLDAIAKLRSDIMEREIRLKVLRTSATDENPDVIKLNSEIQGMKAELTRLEASQPQSPKGQVDAAMAADLSPARLPQATIDQIRLRREVRFQESMLQNLLLQLESARLDEAKEGIGPQVVDPAVPPDKPSKPKVPLMVIGGYLVGLLATAAWIIIKRRVSLQPLRDAVHRNA